MNIAECESKVQSCNLLDNKKYTEYYTVAHTGSGGIIFVIRLNEDTYGTYSCVATFNSSISASVDVLKEIKEEQPEIRIRKMEFGSTAAIECIGNTDITFQFKSDYFTTTINIAECGSKVQLCSLIDEKYAKYYSVSHTGSGGILSIHSLNEDTYGTYTCVAKYYSNMSASTQIYPPRSVVSPGLKGAVTTFRTFNDVTNNYTNVRYAYAFVILLCIGVALVLAKFCTCKLPRFLPGTDAGKI
ncbi:hypothetical protein DPMN_023401 [Dreissena polymorpha]|uniref:Uncharacterized protein n=2 Tax=Dreissena polymorpha TaxID=45954 RepID=A0A9D4LPL7_DREPO|nr:hypothetical protein DPMN_023401 [Dreissena polymorpha]